MKLDLSTLDLSTLDLSTLDWQEVPDGYQEVPDGYQEVPRHYRDGDIWRHEHGGWIYATRNQSAESNICGYCLDPLPLPYDPNFYDEGDAECMKRKSPNGVLPKWYEFVVEKEVAWCSTYWNTSIGNWTFPGDPGFDKGVGRRGIKLVPREIDPRTLDEDQLCEYFDDTIGWDYLADTIQDQLPEGFYFYKSKVAEKGDVCPMIEGWRCAEPGRKITHAISSTPTTSTPTTSTPTTSTPTTSTPSLEAIEQEIAELRKEVRDLQKVAESIDNIRFGETK